eukprot:gene3283-3792_t
MDSPGAARRIQHKPPGPAEELEPSAGHKLLAKGHTLYVDKRFLRSEKVYATRGSLKYIATYFSNFDTLSRGVREPEGSYHLCDIFLQSGRCPLWELCGNIHVASPAMPGQWHMAVPARVGAEGLEYSLLPRFPVDEILPQCPCTHPISQVVLESGSVCTTPLPTMMPGMVGEALSSPYFDLMLGIYANAPDFSRYFDHTAEVVQIKVASHPFAFPAKCFKLVRRDKEEFYISHNAAITYTFGRRPTTRKALLASSNHLKAAVFQPLGGSSSPAAHFVAHKDKPMVLGIFKAHEAGESGSCEEIASREIAAY